MVDRSALDRPIAAGGYCSTGTGQAPDGNALPVGREQATTAFSGTCIGCGACVASCRNASASLFVAAKLAHLGQLPQGNRSGGPSRSMQEQMQAEGFGSCSSNLECEAVCPRRSPRTGSVGCIVRNDAKPFQSLTCFRRKRNPKRHHIKTPRYLTTPPAHPLQALTLHRSH